MKKKIFSPLIFLASLGAGGISIIPFAFLQYTFPHGKGLIKIADVTSSQLTLLETSLMYILDLSMIIFTAIHIVLTIFFLVQLFDFIKGDSYKDLITDPLKNSVILAPFISIIMTMNVFIGPVRFFVPGMAENLQDLMLPAFIFWIFIFLALMRMEIRLLKTSFVEGFDINKITFGWLLHPFALGMLTVTGTGIAAMAHDSAIAHTAAFMSLISGSMGMFLFVVKIISVFQKHFSEKGLGEKQFLPSFLIVIPNITLYAISAFRFGHYLENQHGMHLDAYFIFVIGGAFAFQTWYLIFGLSLLKNYFKEEYFKKEFHVTQWGLICPFVAYAVLASFIYSVFYNSWIFYAIALIFLVISVTFYGDLFMRYLRCEGFFKKSVNCR